MNVYKCTASPGDPLSILKIEGLLGVYISNREISEGYGQNYLWCIKNIFMSGKKTIQINENMYCAHESTFMVRIILQY